MREDEAKTKWCPQAAIEKSLRLHSLTVCQISSPSNKSMLADFKELALNDYQKCIASDCMMWRWKISPTRAAEINARVSASAVNDGYCGIAGLRDCRKAMIHLLQSIAVTCVFVFFLVVAENAEFIMELFKLGCLM